MSARKSKCHDRLNALPCFEQFANFYDHIDCDWDMEGFCFRGGSFDYEFGPPSKPKEIPDDPS